MNDNNELPLKLLSKCINCNLKFTNEFKGFKTIKFYAPSQQHRVTLQSTADEEKNLLLNHLTDNNLVDEIEIEVIDVISYIYGVSYQHLLFSYLKTNRKSLLPKIVHSSTRTGIAVNDSNVAMCSKCAKLFERLYKVFKDFDKASSTHSILKGAIKCFRDEHLNTSNEKLNCKYPNSFKVKLDRDDEMEDNCDMDGDSFFESDSQNEYSNTSFVFQQTRVKKEDKNVLKDDVSTSAGEAFVKRNRKNTYRVLPGLDSGGNLLKNHLEITDRDNEMDGKCDVETFNAFENHNNEIYTTYTFEEAEVTKEEDDPLQSLDVDYTASGEDAVSALTSKILVKHTRKNTYRVFPEKSFAGLDSGDLLKRRQQLKTKVNEAAFQLKKKKIVQSKMNSSADRFRLVWCCGVRFAREKKFLDHKNERHNGQDEFPCEYCQKVIPIKVMSKHLFETHKIKFNHLNNSQPKEKVVDNEEVDKECLLDENEKDIDTNELWRGYTCEFCDTVMYFFHEFESHMTQHKKPEIGKIIFPYICCKVSLQDYKTLQEHRRENHNTSILKVQCQFCKEFLHKASIKGHLKTQHKYEEARETFKCPKCDLAHGTIQNLTRHQISEGHQMEVICGIDNCKRIYKTEESMRKHKRQSHFGDLKYPCRFCGKLFRNRNARASHHDKHELEHQIVCDECGKTFKTKNSYRCHRLKHRDSKLGRENFKCADCDKCFVDRQGLNKHIRIFHREDLKKVFTCEQCGKTTKNMTNMRIHQRIHDPDRIVNQKKKSPQVS